MTEKEEQTKMDALRAMPYTTAEEILRFRLTIFHLLGVLRTDLHAAREAIREMVEE